MKDFESTNSVLETVAPLTIAKGASLAAIGLHLVLAQWSAQSLSDGFLPLYVVDQLGNEELFDELVEKELWTRTPDGFRLANWHDEQESAAAALANRDAAAERVRRHRAKLASTTVLQEAEEIIAQVEIKKEIEKPEPVLVAEAEAEAEPEKPRRGVAYKIPDLNVDGSDTNFDEFLDVMQTLPDDDTTCWKAWIEVSKAYYPEDILDAADDYQMRVPRRKRMLPEVWLSQHEYLQCAPFNTPMDLT